MFVDVDDNNNNEDYYDDVTDDDDYILTYVGRRVLYKSILIV